MELQINSDANLEARPILAYIQNHQYYGVKLSFILENNLISPMLCLSVQMEESQAAMYAVRQRKIVSFEQDLQFEGFYDWRDFWIVLQWL